MLTRSNLTLMVLLSWVVPQVAHAQAPVYIWGFNRGCERLTEAERAVEKRLHSATQTVSLLRGVEGKALPPCQGEKCVELFRSSCPAAAGLILGGEVVQGSKGSRLSKFRLWLHDTATGQMAYQDDYCQSCSLNDALTAQAKALIERPRFGSSPGTNPTYCGGAIPPDLTRSGPLYLAVYGDNKQRGFVHGALEQQLHALGRNPQPAPTEARTYTLDILQQMVAGQQNARVLGAEVKKDGKVDLFLFDQRTALTEDKTLTCAGCDRDSLIIQVKQAVAELLDHCFGAQCAGSGATPPVEACEPFSFDSACGGPSLVDQPQASGSYMDPGTAKLVKGSLWGLFAASTLTSVILLAANFTSAGTWQDVKGVTVTRQLWYPGWAVGGVAIGILGVSIPITIRVNQATKREAPNQTTLVRQLQCPN